MTFPLEKIVTVVPELSNSPLGSEYRYVGVHHTQVEVLPSVGTLNEPILEILATGLLLFLKKIPENTSWLIGYSGPLIVSVGIGNNKYALIASYTATALVPKGSS